MRWNSDSNAVWPKKAVVTAGMPYGNKPLHFGHIGGVFIPADAFARFLRDRIGRENVRFVSGTDCFGSPINEGYRKAVENEGFTGSISDYVERNHTAQAKVLADFEISTDIFEGSGIGHAGEVHQDVTDAFIRSLYEQKTLELDSTLQFFDAQANTFLNGRQVQGHCPVQGCKSEHGYADECDLGHQYQPTDLINPISSLTGTVPEMRPVKNWYFDLPSYSDFLKDVVRELEEDEQTRAVVPKTIKEFLGAPIIFVKNELFPEYECIIDKLPPHTMREAEAGKQSFSLEFDSVSAREEACAELSANGIRFRTSKTLVPFRITGNIEWGVHAPVLEGVEGLTVWCWPESLWAPISFTIAANDEMGLPRDTWRDFWCDDASQVYQFIGQDNLYFYGVAQPAMWHALGSHGIFGGAAARPLKQTRLIANHHLLFGKAKASSSGSVKPPSGEDLLEHYTVEQLRAHFLALGLDQKSVNFAPKPFDPKLTDEQKQDNRIADPVLKEGALLTNVFNRLARSCLYEAAKNFDGYMPVGPISTEVLKGTQKAMIAYDNLMHKVEFHSVMQLADEFIRWAQKYWADGIKEVTAGENDDEISPEHEQLLCDCFYMLRVAILLMHPICPKGCELICDYMDFDADDVFSWNFDFESNEELCSALELDEGRHQVRPLPPRFDFFPKHHTQIKD